MCRSGRPAAGSCSRPSKAGVSTAAPRQACAVHAEEREKDAPALDHLLKALRDGMAALREERLPVAGRDAGREQQRHEGDEQHLQRGKCGSCVSRRWACVVGCALSQDPGCARWLVADHARSSRGSRRVRRGGTLRLAMRSANGKRAVSARGVACARAGSGSVLLDGLFRFLASRGQRSSPNHGVRARRR